MGSDSAGTGNLISLVFLVLLYYSLGTALESVRGELFRYNVYIFSDYPVYCTGCVRAVCMCYYFRYGVEVPLSIDRT